MVSLVASRSNEEKRDKNDEQGEKKSLRNIQRWVKRQLHLLATLSFSSDGKNADILVKTLSKAKVK